MTIERFSSPSAINAVIESYAAAKRPAILSDYDGVLREIQPTPPEAAPVAQTIETIQRISSDPATTFAIITGRDKATVDAWFGGLDIELSAEHGCLRKDKMGSWIVEHALRPNSQRRVLTCVDAAIAALPDSFKEVKDAGGVAWHYRGAAEHDLEAALVQAHNLYAALKALERELPVHVIDGDRVIEVQPRGATKGVAIGYWLNQGYDWVMYLGDDTTDAAAVEALEASDVPQKYTMGVGAKDIGARLQIADPAAVRDLFDAMSRARRMRLGKQ